MKITCCMVALLLAVGYLGLRVVEYVTVMEGTHRIVMGENR